MSNPSSPDSAKLAELCALHASGKKATDITILDLRGLSTVTDFFVVCSGTSGPQLKAISDEVQDQLREAFGIKPLAVDGYPASQWVIVDFAQVVVHVFAGDKRAFYDLERLWGDAPSVRYEAPAAISLLGPVKF